MSKLIESALLINNVNRVIEQDQKFIIDQCDSHLQSVTHCWNSIGMEIEFIRYKWEDHNIMFKCGETQSFLGSSSDSDDNSNCSIDIHTEIGDIIIFEVGKTENESNEWIKILLHYDTIDEFFSNLRHDDKLTKEPQFIPAVLFYNVIERLDKPLYEAIKDDQKSQTQIIQSYRDLISDLADTYKHTHIETHMPTEQLFRHIERLNKPFYKAIDLETEASQKQIIRSYRHCISELAEIVELNKYKQNYIRHHVESTPMMVIPDKKSAVKVFQKGINEKFKLYQS